MPAVGPDFPDFSEPTKGFEPRGTDLMKRVVTHQDTLSAAINANELRCQYSSNSTNRKRRNAQPITICGADEYRRSSFVTVYESGSDLFNVNDLKTICKMEKRIVRATPGFDHFCTCYSTTSSACGSSLSLGTYIASIRNRSSCQNITEEDVTYARKLLQTCASLYFNAKLNNRTECANEEDFIKNIFELLVDIDFMRNSESLRSTIVLSPRYYDTDFAREIYEQHLSDGNPEQNGVKLVAFKFDDFKYDEFNRKLLVDAVFPAIGLVMVAIILLVYTHSVVVMVLTIFSIITSIIIAYFIYHQVFRLTFFPFLNILTFIFLVGIGADDAFVFNDVWSQAKRSLPDGKVEDWIEYTLKHAALSMFVTSFTTSAAFYANVVSDITAIRLFGIFSGTSILIMYSLMITWFPAGVVFVEKIRKRSRNVPVRTVGLELRGINPPLNSSDTSNNACGIPPDNNPSTETVPEKTNPSSDVGEFPSNSPAKINDVPTTPQGTVSTANTQSTPLAGPCACYSTLRTKCSEFMCSVFENWIPKCLRGYPILLIVFLALGIGMVCAVTVSPGLQRPKSSDFQVFASSHILEQYDLKYKNKFRLEQTSQNNFWVYIFFGFKAEDNGNYLEPKNFGKLQYDDSLDVLQPEAQKWFLLELCSNIRKLKFFGRSISWLCYPEVFHQTCTDKMNWSLPLNETQLDYCLKSFYTPNCLDFNERSSGLFFGQNNEIKGISLAFPTGIQFTNDYKTVDNLWSGIQEISSSVLDKAPEGMKNGWAISWLRFYALQKNLGSSTITSLAVSLTIAFGVMLLTSLNWVISVYAIVTIICILATTIGSLVLDGWELNILESIVISVAVGLSVDFTLHYGVAYTVSSEQGRRDQVKYALSHIGPAVTLAALTTFIAGVFMMFSTVLAYFQLGQFLTLVMAISWLFATLFFMSLCYFAGPVGHFGQINSTKCVSCKVSPRGQQLNEEDK